MFPRLTLLLALTLFCGTSAPAQDAPLAPAKVTAPNALADELKEYSDLFNRGFYDELIFKANLKIAEMGDTPDIPPLYFRGWAYYKLGWFPLAEADLNAVRNAGVYFPSKGYASVLNGLNGIERYKKVMPPHMQEIRQDGRLLFRMYYFSMEGGTATVQALLPEAHRISSEMFGSNIEAAPVVVFDTYEQYRAFNKVLTGTDKLSSWSWARSLENFVMISLEFPDGSSSSRDHRSRFTSTIFHEVNHLTFRHLMGKTWQPRWFEEGTAQVAESRVSEDYDPVRQKVLKRLFANDALITFEELKNSSLFTEQVELGIVMRNGEDSQSAPDPYTQAYGMTKYLLANISTAQLQNFLNRNRESRDFYGAFQDEFGFSVEQFYERWKRDTARRFAAQ